MAGEQPGTERYDNKQRQTRGKEVFETPGIDAWAGIGFSERSRSCAARGALDRSRNAIDRGDSAIRRPALEK
jgi:hypothetical protein